MHIIDQIDPQLVTTNIDEKLPSTKFDYKDYNMYQTDHKIHKINGPLLQTNQARYLLVKKQCLRKKLRLKNQCMASPTVTKIASNLLIGYLLGLVCL